jgi:hypothetical protein
LLRFAPHTSVNAYHGSFVALQLRSAGDAQRCRRRACKILMETRIARGGLDHILDAVNDRIPVDTARNLAKVRTTSQIGPDAATQANTLRGRHIVAERTACDRVLV